MNLLSLETCPEAGNDSTNESYPVVFLGQSKLLSAGLSEAFQSAPDIEFLGMVDSPRHLASISAADQCVVLTIDAANDAESDDRKESSAWEGIAKRTVHVVLSLTPQSLSSAMRHQSAGYVTLYDAIPDILDVVRQVGRGHQAISPGLRSHLRWATELNQFVLNQPGLFQSLTQRQIDVMTRIARGDSVKEIAREMHLSQKSVDSHKYRIMQKLGLHDRVQVTRLAIREGLLSP